LQAGGLILYPTDTIWGIGCDATNEKAVEKIYQLKKRSDKKTMIILVAEEKDIFKYVNYSGEKLFKYLEQVAKPTTVVYQYSKGLAKNLIGEDNTIAIRICKDRFCHDLIKEFDKPIVSTSANISGGKPPTNFFEISDEIKNGVDHIVKYRQEDTAIAVPSTVIRWENENPIVIRP
jgi:L-threonylcarbamoyladenylate synthase